MLSLIQIRVRASGVVSRRFRSPGGGYKSRLSNSQPTFCATSDSRRQVTNGGQKRQTVAVSLFKEVR
jgi:hypothetical protein